MLWRGDRSASGRHEPMIVVLVVAGFLLGLVIVTAVAFKPQRIRRRDAPLRLRAAPVPIDRTSKVEREAGRPSARSSLLFLSEPVVHPVTGDALAGELRTRVEPLVPLP